MKLGMDVWTHKSRHKRKRHRVMEKGTSQIGSQLMRWREAAGLTQAAAAIQMRVDAATVSRWERGSTTKIKTENVIAIANVYNVPIVQVMSLLGFKADGVGVLVPPGGSRAGDQRQARIVAFERDMITLGANELEADHVRETARAFLESAFFKGGAPTQKTEAEAEAEVDEDLEILLEYSLKPWVMERIARRRRRAGGSAT